MIVICHGTSLKKLGILYREAQKGDDICIVMAELHCCMEETKITL